MEIQTFSFYKVSLITQQKVGSIKQESHFSEGFSISEDEPQTKKGVYLQANGASS